MNMIDLTRIRSKNVLSKMKNDLDYFINEPIIKEIYLSDYNWNEDDYEADKEDAIYLLSKVEKRIESLSRMKTVQQETSSSVKTITEH